MGDNNMRKYRVLRSFSQEQLARCIGVTRESICRIEKGKTNPSLDLALRIAKALHCTVEELFLPETDNILQ